LLKDENTIPSFVEAKQIIKDYGYATEDDYIKEALKIINSKKNADKAISINDIIKLIDKVEGGAPSIAEIKAQIKEQGLSASEADISMALQKAKDRKNVNSEFTATETALIDQWKYVNDIQTYNAVVNGSVIRCEGKNSKGQSVSSNITRKNESGKYDIDEEFFVKMKDLPKNAKLGDVIDVPDETGQGYHVKIKRLDNYGGSAGAWVKVLTVWKKNSSYPTAVKIDDQWVAVDKQKTDKLWNREYKNDGSAGGDAVMEVYHGIDIYKTTMGQFYLANKPFKYNTLEEIKARIDDWIKSGEMKNSGKGSVVETYKGYDILKAGSNDYYPVKKGTRADSLTDESWGTLQEAKDCVDAWLKGEYKNSTPKLTEHQRVTNSDFAPDTKSRSAAAKLGDELFNSSNIIGATAEIEEFDDDEWDEMSYQEQKDLVIKIGKSWNCTEEEIKSLQKEFQVI
jgi:hypothetical protein